LLVELAPADDVVDAPIFVGAPGVDRVVAEAADDALEGVVAEQLAGDEAPQGAERGDVEVDELAGDGRGG
jgi:hypothetical protein